MVNPPQANKEALRRIKNEPNETRKRHVKAKSSIIQCFIGTVKSIAFPFKKFLCSPTNKTSSALLPK